MTSPGTFDRVYAAIKQRLRERRLQAGRQARARNAGG